MTPLNQLAVSMAKDGVPYGDLIHIVHVAIIEPHPKAPDVSPYRGGISEVSYSIPQPRSYAERLAVGQKMEAMLAGEQLLLVDRLGAPGQSNPIWCSYAVAPNAAFLIDREGTLRRTWLWFNPGEAHAAVDSLLAQ